MKLYKCRTFLRSTAVLYMSGVLHVLNYVVELINRGEKHWNNGVENGRLVSLVMSVRDVRAAFKPLA